MYRKFGKRLMDILLSFTAIVVLSPLFLGTALLVRVKLGKPVLFRQERPGKGEKIFAMYKFRSMTDKRDEAGNLLPDEDRLPEFGKKLRSTSLDELPELLNILKGDMSIVGPRPLLVEYLPLYNEEQKKRHLVRPGLTGLAQAEGRNLLSWEQRFAYDVEYVEHISFLKDVSIMLKTVSLVFKGSGVHSESSVTMEDFKGSGTEDQK